MYRITTPTEQITFKKLETANKYFENECPKGSYLEEIFEGGSYTISTK